MSRILCNGICRLSSIFIPLPTKTLAFKNIETNYYSFKKIENSSPCSKTFHTSAGLFHGEYEREPPKSEEDVVNILVVDRDSIEFSIKGKVGDNVMMLAQNHDVDVEGACEASLACCTCHVYVDAPYLERLDSPVEKEEDLLDMAPFLAETSRLSCQIILRKDLDGMTVRLPVGTRNMRVDQKGQQSEDVNS